MKRKSQWYPWQEFDDKAEAFKSIKELRKNFSINIYRLQRVTTTERTIN